MKINQVQLNNFKKIYKEYTGAEIDDEKAIELAQKLLTLVKFVYKPIKKSDEQDARQMKINF